MGQNLQTGFQTNSDYQNVPKELFIDISDLLQTQSVRQTAWLNSTWLLCFGVLIQYLVISNSESEEDTSRWRTLASATMELLDYYCRLFVNDLCKSLCLKVI